MLLVGAVAVAAASAVSVLSSYLVCHKQKRNYLSVVCSSSSSSSKERKREKERERERA